MRAAKKHPPATHHRPVQDLKTRQGNLDLRETIIFPQPVKPCRYDQMKLGL
jgi:hypothetical protein